MSPEVERRNNQIQEEVSRQKTPAGLLDLAERGGVLHRDQVQALQNLLAARPGAAVGELAENVPPDYGFKDKALRLLAESPEFERETAESIARATTLDELHATLRSVPGVVGGDDRFYSGDFLSNIVGEVAQKSIEYAEANGLEEISEENFHVPEFILNVGYAELTREGVLIPTASLGLRAKFIALVNREILSRGLDSEVEAFLNRGTDTAGQ